MNKVFTPGGGLNIQLRCLLPKIFMYFYTGVRGMGVTNIDETFLFLVNKKFTYHYFQYSKYVINWFYLLYFISESNLARAAGNLFWSCTSYQSIWIKIQTIVRVIFLFKFIGHFFFIKLYPFDQNDWKYKHCGVLKFYSFVVFYTIKTTDLSTRYTQKLN